MQTEYTDDDEKERVIASTPMEDFCNSDATIEQVLKEGHILEMLHNTIDHIKSQRDTSHVAYIDVICQGKKMDHKTRCVCCGGDHKKDIKS